MKKSFWQLLRIVGSYRSWSILAITLGFLTIGSAVGLMMTSAYLISMAALHPFLSQLQVAIVGVRFFGISRGVFRYLERIISHETTFRILARLRVWFYRALEPLAPARLMKYHSGDLLTRILSDIENLEHIFVRVIAPPVVALLVTLLMWVLLGTLSLVIPLILTVFLLLSGVALPLLIQRLSGGIGRRLVKLRSQLHHQAIDGIQGLPELLVYGRAHQHLLSFQNLNRQYVRLQRRMAIIEAFQEASIGLSMNLAVATVLYAAIPLVSNNLINGVYLAVIVMGTMAAFEAVTPLPAAIQYLEQSLHAGKRLLEIIDAKPQEGYSGDSNIEPERFDIHISELTFGYEPGGPPVLQNLNLHIPKGSRTAIVGVSGAGKTTLISLLLRFWDYAAGSIRIGGVELRTIRKKRLNDLLAVMPQSTYLFAGTIRENLQLARPEATQSELDSVVEKARLRDFIDSLPEGFETYVGEHGLRLSGGEQQRLALARTLLMDSAIFIFDEPTANLDALTEKEILHSILAIAPRKTVVLITHRLTGLQQCDQILVLSAGKLVESGTHEALLSARGYYYQLWQKQQQIRTVETLA